MALGVLSSISGKVLGVAQGVSQITGLFKSGSSGAAAREAKRRELQKLGFRWDRTKGFDEADRDNIDGFKDKALDNLFIAYEGYGKRAVDAHNQGLLTDQIAQNYSALERVIQQSTVTDSIDFSNFQFPSGEVSEIFTGQNVVVAAAAAVILFLIFQGK
jgi:hypothetical protein